MKAILINSKNQSVTEVNLNGSKTLDEWYRLLECQMVEVAMELPHDDFTGNTIMVDEEGLLSLTPDTKFFLYEGGHQPFAGNGLVVGINYGNGKTIDCTLTADYVRSKVKFRNLQQVKKWVETNG